jgi:sarcosine oxidase subunit gamma
MLDVSAMRQGPLDALAGAACAGAAVELSLLPPRARFVLRCRAEWVAAAGQTFGVALPETACRAAVAGGRAALWFGPDEWLLLAASDNTEEIANQVSAALAGAPHAIVDVSHRSVAIAVKGAQAAALINHGCALDLVDAAFPVGMCTRTLFEKAEIILWRVEAHTYHVEIERSFAPYVWLMLSEAREELT